MKKLIIYIMLNLLCLVVCNGQSVLKDALDRYDYKAALHIIDSLSVEDSSSAIDLAIQKSRCLRRLYRMDEAIEALTDVLYLDQFNTVLLAELAETHVQAGNTMDAFNLYGVLSRMQPDNPYFKIMRARILYREKKYGDSISICKELIVKDSIPEILSLTADAYKNMGKVDSALVYYDHVLLMRPRHVSTMSKKADILLTKKQCQPVIEMSGEYLKDDPDNMTMLPIYGLALYLNGDYQLSLETFGHLCELDEKSYGAHYYLGLNHYMLKNWHNAIEELDKAYQIDSSDVTLVYHLANAKSHMTPVDKSGKPVLNPESERLYARALSMIEPSPTMMQNIYGSMAVARHTVEQYEEAIKYYKLSYKYNPRNISALSSIGYCYERLKNYKKALEYYQLYKKVGKPGTEGYKFVEESIRYVTQEKFMQTPN